MWFIGLAVFFVVLKVISDITHWDLLMSFVGTDLCVNERIMQSDRIPIVIHV